MELAFPWAKCEPNLGIEYVPVCTVSIQKKNKKCLERVFKIDSGSDITFMDKEDCQNLGYELGDCKDTWYTDTNNERYRVYVKFFNLKIGDYEIKRVPIGFSSKRVQMLLLGRAKIFDFFDICFHAELNIQYLDVGNKRLIRR